jgi:hypothetical protein
VQTNSKLNQGEVIKVGILKKEKISGMPAWFKEWSETVYQKKAPQWFQEWSETVYQNIPPKWFQEYEIRANARFDKIEKRLDEHDAIFKRNNLR